jgi:hypothetical protein
MILFYAIKCNTGWLTLNFTMRYLDPLHVTTRGHSFKLHKVLCSLDATKYFFTNRIHEVWNELPASVVASGTITLFKRRLHNINLCAHLRYPCFHFT